MKFKKNYFYITPLYKAIQDGNKDIAKLLLTRHEIDVNYRSI